MAGNQRKQAVLAGASTRVTGVTGDQAVKATPGNLHRIVIRNADAGPQTLTIKDGAATKIVCGVAAGVTVSLDFGYAHGTSIIVTPSVTTIDALVLYD